ncbi:unnamed protein product [Rhodiola kirilowii]
MVSFATTSLPSNEDNINDAGLEVDLPLTSMVVGHAEEPHCSKMGISVEVAKKIASYNGYVFTYDDLVGPVDPRTYFLYLRTKYADLDAIFRFMDGPEDLDDSDQVSTDHEMLKEPSKAENLVGTSSNNSLASLASDKGNKSNVQEGTDSEDLNEDAENTVIHISEENALRIASYGSDRFHVEELGGPVDARAYFMLCKEKGEYDDHIFQNLDECQKNRRLLRNKGRRQKKKKKKGSRPSGRETKA